MRPKHGDNTIRVTIGFKPTNPMKRGARGQSCHGQRQTEPLQRSRDTRKQ
jgi:hypothetical protein